MAHWRSLTLSAGLLLMVPYPAFAAQKFTSFKDAMAKSESIVVATLLAEPKFGDSKVSIEVRSVIKGKLSPGKQDVAFEDLPNTKSKEFIAFLDKDGVWRFIAEPLHDQPVAKDVLAVRGFNDSNAHFVSPGLITLEQLKTYLKNGSLLYRFAGPVCFPEPGKTEWKASKMRITGTYDGVNHVAEVLGLPALKGFPAQPQISVYDEWFGQAVLTLTYADSGNRPMTFIARVDGFDAKSGKMQVRFAVSEPELLTEQSLRDYLANEHHGECYSRFRLNCAPTKDHPKGQVLTLTFGGKYGLICRIEGWGKAALEIEGTSYRTPNERSGSASAELPKNIAKDAHAPDGVLQMFAPTGAGEYLILGFDIGPPRENKNGFQWPFQNKILYSIYAVPVRGTVHFHDGKTLQKVTTFTVALDKVGFMPIEKR